MFQFKVIHNALPTRATLYRDGISESLHVKAVQRKNAQTCCFEYIIHKYFSLEFLFVFKFGLGFSHVLNIFTSEVGLGTFVNKGWWIFRL